MKKTILATAIAGVFGAVATGAQAVTVYNQDDTKVDLYGSLELAVGSEEVAQNDSAGNYIGTDSESQLFDNGSTIGFAGEHVINPSLVGYFQAEFEFAADDMKDGNGLDSGDNAYLGMKGDFGDVRVGSWDPLINDWVEDPITFDESYAITSGITGGDSGVDEGNKVTYTSPVMSGLQFAVGTNYIGDGDRIVKAFDGDRIVKAFDGGESINVKADGNASFYTGLRYMVGDVVLSAAYDNLDNYEVTNAAGNVDDYGDQYGVSAAWQATDAFYIAVKAEQFDGDYADRSDVSYYGLGASYDYGMGSLYGTYQNVDAERNAITFFEESASSELVSLRTSGSGDESYNEIMLGATYNISSQMYVWVEGRQLDREDDLGDGYGTGITYQF